MKIHVKYETFDDINQLTEIYKFGTIFVNTCLKQIYKRKKKNECCENIFFNRNIFTILTNRTSLLK